MITAAPQPQRARLVAPRLRLAQLASAAALDVHGVAGLDRSGDPARATAHGGQRVLGVACVASGEGGYDVTLFVAVRPVPFEAVAEQLRAAVRAAACDEGVQDDLRHVHVVVADLVEPQDEP